MAAKRQVDKLAERAVRDQRTVRTAPQAARRPAAHPASGVRSDSARADRLRTDRVQRVASRQPATAPRPAAAARPEGVRPPEPRKRVVKPAPKPASKPTPKLRKQAPVADDGGVADRYIWFSLLLLFVAGFMAVSTVSYLIYWKADQNIANWSNLFISVQQDAQNWGGRLGAILGHNIIGRWFGIFGELLPLIVFFIAIKLLQLKSLRLRRAIRSTLMLMIVGSIGAGHFFGPDPQVFGSGWGGAHGVFIAQWLNAIIGYEGTALLVIAAFCGTLYYANGLLIRNWAAKLRAYKHRKAEERQTRLELQRLEAQEKMLHMRAAMEQRRQELAEQQARMEEQEAEARAAAAASAASAAEPNATEAGKASETSAPGSSVVGESSPAQAAAAVADGGTAQAVASSRDAGSGPVVSDPQSFEPAAVPLQQVEPTAPVADYPYGLDVPQPVDRARLVQNMDGTWGYLIGYDDWGQPIIYSFDRETYYYNLAYYGAPAPTVGVSDPAASYGAAASGEPEEEPEEENPFTLETRLAASAESEPAAETFEVSATEMPVAAEPLPPVQSEVETVRSQSGPISLSPVVEPIVSAPAAAIQPDSSFEQSVPAAPATDAVSQSSQPSQPFAPQEDDPGFIVEQPEEQQVADEVVNSSDLYDPTLELSHYHKPPIELLDDHTKRVIVTDEELVENKNRIVTTLENFGIRIDTIEATIGPTVTLYEIVPAPGVRISKIKNLEDDIALSLSALGIRIIAPIPGKGTVGIEVPNKDKEIVSMYSVIKSPKFHDSHADLPVALGKTIQNETFVFDLAKMPHLLVAGATGQGKSVGLNAIITSLLYKKHPAELKFILVDPKKVELTLYSKLEKHFLAKMPDAEEAIITDTQKVIYTLNSLCIEMDARYDLLKAAAVRNIKEYNEKFINRRLNPEKGHRYLPYFVVIVDEFADLIMTAGREIETPIARIAQLARAVGIHLIIATQRPTTNIITGVIKANFPARIAFRVTSMIDSRTILDQPGANQLVGRGDMLISTGNEITRVQCAFIDTPEVERITDHIARQQGYPSAYELPEYTPEGEESSTVSGDVLSKRDSLFEEVARYVVANQQGSASTIQRKFSIGFNRAGRLIDQLEAAGIVGHSEGGGKPRQVLVSDPMSLEMILDNLS